MQNWLFNAFKKTAGTPKSLDYIEVALRTVYWSKHEAPNGSKDERIRPALTLINITINVLCLRPVSKVIVGNLWGFMGILPCNEFLDIPSVVSQRLLLSLLYSSFETNETSFFCLFVWRYFMLVFCLVLVCFLFSCWQGNRNVQK